MLQPQTAALAALELHACACIYKHTTRGQLGDLAKSLSGLPALPHQPPPFPNLPQFIAAAGNEATTTVSYPAGYKHPGVIGVAALQSDGALASYSNRGTASNPW